MTIDKLQQGQRITVTQTVFRRETEWTTDVTGTIVEIRDAPTGSWYAHGKKDKYWLKRVTLRKDDGELTMLTLDHNSRITLHEAEAAGA